MRSLNLQPAEKLSHDPDNLDVIKVFPTIQGEGPFAGIPSVFVRLAGCNLCCSLCDTEYTEGRSLLSVGDLVEKVRAVRSSGLVVITGGEPFRQPLGRFVRKLGMSGYAQIQIETNGTLYQEDFPYLNVSLVCSPKTPTIHERLRVHISALKYILSADSVDPNDGLPTSALGMPYPPARPWPSFPIQNVYVQPLDDGGPSQRHEQAAIKSCLKYGYRLSYQIHKLLGLE